MNDLIAAWRRMNEVISRLKLTENMTFEELLMHFSVYWLSPYIRLVGGEVGKYAIYTASSTAAIFVWHHGENMAANYRDIASGLGPGLEIDMNYYEDIYMPIFAGYDEGSKTLVVCRPKPLT